MAITARLEYFLTITGRKNLFVGFSFEVVVLLSSFFLFTLNGSLG